MTIPFWTKLLVVRTSYLRQNTECPRARRFPPKSGQTGKQEILWHRNITSKTNAVKAWKYVSRAQTSGTCFLDESHSPALIKFTLIRPDCSSTRSVSKLWFSVFLPHPSVNLKNYFTFRLRKLFLSIFIFFPCPLYISGGNSFRNLCGFLWKDFKRWRPCLTSYATVNRRQW